MKQDIVVPKRFSTRAFFVQHLAPYEYVRKFAKEKIVLDAATADGYGAFHVGCVAKEVVGIDIDQEAIEKAKNAYKEESLKFLLENVLDIDFPEEYFDIVISCQTIEHIELDKLDRYLSEIHRVLKKGGMFFVSTLNLTHNLKGRSETEYNKSPYHVKEFRHADLKNFLLTRFMNVEILGLQRAPRNNFYNMLKKGGIFKNLPDRFNPVKRFYDAVINTNDFVYSTSNLDNSFDLLGVCRK